MLKFQGHLNPPPYIQILEFMYTNILEPMYTNIGRDRGQASVPIQGQGGDRRALLQRQRRLTRPPVADLPVGGSLVGLSCLVTGSLVYLSCLVLGSLVYLSCLVLGSLVGLSCLVLGSLVGLSCLVIGSLMGLSCLVVGLPVRRKQYIAIPDLPLRVPQSYHCHTSRHP